jgi:hypothetical protein
MLAQSCEEIILNAATTIHQAEGPIIGLALPELFLVLL